MSMDNKQPEGLERLNQDIGTMAEMTRLYYEHYLRVGFNSVQALMLAKDITLTQIKIFAQKERRSEGDEVW